MSVLRRITEKLFRLEPESCSSCDTLRLLLESSRDENARLVQALIDTTKPQQVFEVMKPPEDLKPISGNFIPWRVRREQLESEDRAKARILQQRKKETSELESQVGINATAAETTKEEVAG